ncbi:MAG: ATP-binding protein [Lachnospiraceae bacterium]|nr:ATP-binding protein [Lachnospiraceae bacterium]
MKSNKTKSARLRFFWPVSILLGILFFLLVFFSAAKDDMASTEEHLSDTVNYLKKQCSTYTSLNLASETKSLMRIIECSQQVARNMESDETLSGQAAPDDDVLQQFTQELYISGILFLDANGNLTGEYYTDDIGSAGLQDTLDKENLLDVASYPQKTYSSRITCEDGSYLDLAAVGRTDTSGIIVTYYHTPLDYIESYSLSFQDLLSGYSITRNSTIVITSGDKVIASNEDSLKGANVNDIEVLRNMNEKSVNGQMVHVHNTASAPGHVFGMLDRGRNYYIYVYLPEHAVFETTPRKVFYYMFGYICLLLIFQMVRWRTAQNYQKAQLKKDKIYQETLKEAAEKAESANLAKTEFLQRMSHDIRTPINGIRGMVEIAGHYKDDPVKQQECLGKIWDASGLLLELVNEVLDMGKLESGEIVLESRPFHVLHLVEDITAVVEKQAVERGIEIISEVPSVQHPYLIGSPLHIKRLLMNIVSNAVKYNKENGKVMLGCHEISCTDDTAWIEVTCSDTGIGMSKEFQEHLFEPFTQESHDARSTYNGTGLGMAIVKNLLDKMGGTIDFSSEKDVGTTYRITIPFRIDSQMSDFSETETAFEEISLSGNHVLLAEDNILNLEIAEFILEDAGATVTTARNGEEALHLFMEASPYEYDIILMDIMMPVMDGYQATSAIRSSDRPDAKTIPILAMTANAFAEDRQKTYAAGMNEHLTKPLDTELVLKTVAKYTAKKEAPSTP